MSLVSAKSIKRPHMKVTPPRWVKITLGSLLIMVYLAVAFVPSLGAAPKISIMSLFGILLLAGARKALGNGSWETMRINRDGIYFKTDEPRTYFFVPWRCVGSIEKAPFALHKRTLRIEITGDYKSSVSNTARVANVMSVGDKLYVYTLPRLNDRDRLIEKMLNYKRPVFE